MVAKGDVLSGKYRLERFLGSGGFASVWAARNIDIDRPVALKVLTENLARERDVVTRFVREATIAAKQIHPTILRVEDIGKTRDDIPFLVMELLEGATLSQEIKIHGSLPVAECIDISRQVLEGLAAAHVRGIIHRDIKPSNIFVLAPMVIAGPRVRILDLGLAKDITAGTGVTSSGQWMGTPDYLPPELFLADQWRELGPSGDVFAYGVTLFEMITGVRPLDGVIPRGRSPSMLFKRISYYESHTELPRAADIAKGIPEELDTVIRVAMSVDPSRRYADAGQMLSALEQAVLLLREQYPTFEAIPQPVIDTSSLPVSPEMFATPSSAVRGNTESLQSGDLMVDDPSASPTSSKHLGHILGSDSASWSNRSLNIGHHGPPGTIDAPTSEILGPTRRSPVPPLALGAPSQSSGLEDTLPAPQPSESSKGRKLILGISIGAMGLSLIILIVVVILTRTGAQVQTEAMPSQLPIASEVESDTSLQSAAIDTQEHTATADGGPPSETIGDTGITSNVADSSPPSVLPETSPERVKRRPHKRPRTNKSPRIRRGNKTDDFGSAIPFEKLGQQGGD